MRCETRRLISAHGTFSPQSHARRSFPPWRSWWLATNLTVTDNAVVNSAFSAIVVKPQVEHDATGLGLDSEGVVIEENSLTTQLFGIEIDGWEQADLIERARDIPDERAMKFYQWMAETFGTIVAGKEAVIAQIKMYLAMRELIEDKGYDFVAAKCLPELPAVYTTFCLAHAILGDACDAFGQKDPFVFACEADVNAALTMQILKLLAGGPVMFTDLTHYDLKDNLLILCNCGSQPTDFASSKEDVYWEKEGVHEFVWRIGGTCPQHVAKPGAVTLARMGRERGEYLMMMGTGRAIDMPREKLRETVWERPHAFVRPDCPPDRFVENVLSNHIHLVYGDHVEQLEEVCRILKIRPVIL